MRASLPRMRLQPGTWSAGWRSRSSGAFGWPCMTHGRGWQRTPRRARLPAFGRGGTGWTAARTAQTRSAPSAGRCRWPRSTAPRAAPATSRCSRPGRRRRRRPAAQQPAASCWRCQPSHSARFSACGAAFLPGQQHGLRVRRRCVRESGWPVRRCCNALIVSRETSSARAALTPALRCPCAREWLLCSPAALLRGTLLRLMIHLQQDNALRFELREGEGVPRAVGRAPGHFGCPRPLVHTLS